MKFHINSFKGVQIRRWEPQIRKTNENCKENCKPIENCKLSEYKNEM